jgi:hypothetical protein
MIQVDSSDVLGLESSDEYIAMPPGKSVAGVYHQPQGAMAVIQTTCESTMPGYETWSEILKPSTYSRLKVATGHP